MRVVIVGAGLSGLTLAAFLRRVNIDCVVLEQAPFIQAVYHTPYVLFANALSCFKAYGMEYVFNHSGLEPEPCFGIKDCKRRWLMKVRNRNVRLRSLRAEDEVPLSTAPKANSNSIVSRRLMEERKVELGTVPLRTTLSADYLRDALRHHVTEIKFGCQVVDLAPHDGIKGGVHAVLEDGSTEWGDVVVGADGMHSTIRRLLYPGEQVGTSSRSLGVTQVDGFVEVKHCPSGLEFPVEVWGSRRTLALTPLYRHGENRIDFTASLYEPPTELVNTDANVDPVQSLDVFRALLRREFATMGEDVSSMLSHAAVAVPTEALEVPVMPRWFNKRAVLVGEAAHGSLPSFLAQDDSLCVEDAALLATALLDIPLMRDSGFEYAFKQYESVRRDRVEQYIRHSRRARRFAATPHSTIRDATLRFTPSAVVQLSQNWLADWSFSAQQLEIDPKIKLEKVFR